MAGKKKVAGELRVSKRLIKKRRGKVGTWGTKGAAHGDARRTDGGNDVVLRVQLA